MNPYKPGSGFRTSVVFTDINGATVDPPTVVCTYHLPGIAPIVDASPVHDGAAGSGAYHSDFLIPYTLVTSGQAFLQWRASGPAIANNVVTEPPFMVQALSTI